MENREYGANMVQGAGDDSEKLVPMHRLGNGFWVNHQQFEDIRKLANTMTTFREYETAARSTAIYRGIGTITEGVVYNTLKLTGEAGEISDKIGKMYGKGLAPTDEQIEDLKKELGDVLWHLTNLCLDLGLSMEDVANANFEKLQSRQERGVLMSGTGDNR